MNMKQLVLYVTPPFTMILLTCNNSHDLQTSKVRVSPTQLIFASYATHSVGVLFSSWSTIFPKWLLWVNLIQKILTQFRRLCIVYSLKIPSTSFQYQVTQPNTNYAIPNDEYTLPNTKYSAIMICAVCRATFLLQIYTLFGTQFSGLKMALSSNDKYQVYMCTC